MQSRWMIAGLRALAGAALTVVSNIVVEDRKAAHDLERERAARQAAKEEQAASERRKSLEALSAGYDDLGDIVRRAAEFAETGRTGSPDDVRAMFRHFTRVMRFVQTDAASPQEIARYYGAGRLGGWGSRFEAIAGGAAPASSRFSAYERHNFGVLGAALWRLAAVRPPTDPYSATSNAMEGSDAGEAAMHLNAM